mmetsp:Transcript_40633/g.127115  ORF Transcript_40633/g.127115 Transcript_40633/m.127115 type:complete len:88 (+) Transcript_40633:228-491(+)
MEPRALDAAAALFGLGAAEKQSFAAPAAERRRGIVRGYMAPGAESGLRDTFYESKEGFSYGADPAANRWPAECRVAGDDARGCRKVP